MTIPCRRPVSIKLYIMGAVYENYETLISQYGQQQVDSNLYSMITVSDNDAANALTSYLGGGDSSAGMTVVNDFCSTHGFNNTHNGTTSSSKQCI